MTNITDAKVALLTVFGTSPGGYWSETAIPNMPTNVNLVSAGYDQTILNPQVVVGDLVATEDEWLSGKEKLFKAVVDLHTFIRRDLPVSNTDEGTMKKNRQAMNENIRTILVKHPDRPVADIMFMFPRTRAVDRDVRTQREILLHSVQQAEVWYTEVYI